MRSHTRRLGFVALLVAAGAAAAKGEISQPRRTGYFFHVAHGTPGAWPAVFGSIGLKPGPAESAAIIVLRPGTDASPRWAEALERGVYLVLEGQSLAAEMFGFRGTPERVRVRRLEEARRPGLAIVWEQEAELARSVVPQGARVFAKDKWSGAPLLAGYRRGAGGVLWLATDAGEHGYERFPYLPHALRELGFDPPFEARNLWAFFDSSYRLRADSDYLARRWRAAGIAGLHVAAWHFFERDTARDAYLENLIRSCHRQGIAVYAWLELPHVSERFWGDHPAWREKTADQKDAHLDWRKLMNLVNRDCARAVRLGVTDLILRLPWDGVNLAELYFESLEGPANPSRFTPMNTEVRAEFGREAGFDPLMLFQGAFDAGRMRQFLDYRVRLARRLQQEWLTVIEELRSQRLDLDIVLTHVDDRLDVRMRDAIGADSAGLLPWVAERGFTFLVEDPATVWHFSSQRYRELARRYDDLAPDKQRLAVDINVVERYQDVYPTKLQTGLELFQLLHAASSSFARVALYFEKSILPDDLIFLPAATAVADRVRLTEEGLEVETPRAMFVRWRGGATVNGRAWPLGDGERVLVPAGSHRISAGNDFGFKVLDFTGEVLAAGFSAPAGIRLEYESQSRAFAVLSREPVVFRLDGEVRPAILEEREGNWVISLPRGKHVVELIAGEGLNKGSSE